MIKRIISATCVFLAINAFGQLQYPEKLVPYKKGDKWGYSNFNGKLIIDANYDSTAFFIDHRAFIYLDGNIGVINSVGKALIKPIHKELIQLNENYYITGDNGSYGIIDDNGKVIVPQSYEQILPISSNDVLVKKDNNYGVSILENGVMNEVIPFNYDNIYLYELDWKVKKSDYPSGFEIIAVKYNNLDTNYTAFNMRGDKLPIKEEKLKTILYLKDVKGQPKYTTIRIENEQRIISWKEIYSENGKYGLINVDSTSETTSNRSKLFEAIYDDIIATKDGFLVKQSSKWGALNHDGSLSVMIKYDAIQSGFDGTDRVLSDIQALYEGQWGIIARNENEKKKSVVKNYTLLPFKYDSFKPIEGQGIYTIAEKEGKYGIARKTFKYNLIVGCKYDDIDGSFFHLINASFFYKVKNEKGDWVYIHQNGTKYWE